jgi:hypothetical protein
MELFAVFETWHLGDGNYPPLKKGQLVNLSFEFDPEELTASKGDVRAEFLHLGQARYQFAGTVLRVYADHDMECPIAVIGTDDFRFYIYSELAATFRHGDVVIGRGTLLFDHYIWVEYLSEYPDPPDLFYRLRVGEMWQRRIPERFISRGEDGSVGCPTRVEPEDYGPNDIAKVDAVSAAEDFVDYVIQFSDRNVPDETIARTFYS